MATKKITKRKSTKQRKAPCGSAQWRTAFIKGLSNSCNVRAACYAAGVTRAVVYRLRVKSPAFARQWATAETEALELLAAEARRRAMTGSDTLLIYLLKIQGGPAWRQDQKVPLTGPREEPLRGLAPPPSDAERVAEVIGILASLGLLPALAPQAVPQDNGREVAR